MKTSSTTTAHAMPADFELEYQWQEGSLPPPHHYSYRILLRADGSGVVTMIPGYSFQQPPTWTEPFAIAAADLTSLHEFMRARGMPDRKWKTRDQHIVGGSHSSLRWLANGKTADVSSQLAESDRALYGEIVDAVRTRVPDALWSDLLARLRKFQEAN
jgi:hypothetical protein